MSTSRRANDAKPKDLLKIVRGNFGQLDSKDVLLTLDEFCEKHQEFLAEVLEVTMRPTAKLLKNTFQQVWPGALASDYSTMSNGIHDNYKTLFSKARKMASGDRMSEAVNWSCLHFRLAKACQSAGFQDSPAWHLVLLDLPLPRVEARSYLAEAQRTADLWSFLPGSSRSRSLSPPCSTDTMISSNKPVPQAGTRGSIFALCQMVPAASSSRPQIVYHVDIAIPALVKITGNGQEVAEMKPGEKGLLRAICQDGEERDTEIPNLTLQAKSELKTPAAKAAPKAKRKSKAKAARGQQQLSKGQDLQEARAEQEAPAEQEAV